MSEGRRLFVDLPPLNGAESGETAAPLFVPLDSATAHHTRTVLRLNTSDTVVAIDRATGRRFTATIAATTPSVVIRLDQELPHTELISPVHTLIVALCKGEKTDWVCQKACELGVARIVVWQTDRSIVRVEDATAAAKKITRWEKILAAAAQQSNRSSVPTAVLARTTTELTELLAPPGEEPRDRLVCSLEDGTTEMRLIPPPNRGIIVAVGPEGDFTPAEYTYLRSTGFKPVSLGPLVLRAETAAIAAVATANGVWGFRPSAAPLAPTA